MKLFRRPPDFIIGGTENPYLRRWWIARNRFFSIYLHQLLRDDDDRALHDHPWRNASIILRAGYREIVPACDRCWPAHRDTVERHRKPGSIVFRQAEASHRLALYRGADGRPIPAWSLFLTGPRVRKWGFWCPKGWRYYRDFVNNYDNVSGVGRGCD